MDDQTTFSNAPLCPCVVDVEVPLPLQRQHLVRGRLGEPRTVPDLRIGRVEVEVEGVDRRDVQDEPPGLEVERRGRDVCVRLGVHSAQGRRGGEGGGS